MNKELEFMAIGAGIGTFSSILNQSNVGINAGKVVNSALQAACAGLYLHKINENNAEIVRLLPKDKERRFFLENENLAHLQSIIKLSAELLFSEPKTKNRTKCLKAS
jgi:hypothetical protein